jgi:hypothetical protein
MCQMDHLSRDLDGVTPASLPQLLPLSSFLSFFLARVAWLASAPRVSSLDSSASSGPAHHPAAASLHHLTAAHRQSPCCPFQPPL